MVNVKEIKKKDFFKRYKVPRINLFKKGLFSEQDILEAREYEAKTGLLDKIKLFFSSYLSFAVKNPEFIRLFVLPRVKAIFSGLFNSKPQKVVIKSEIEDYEVLVCLAAAFKPKNILEIGTYLGWGAASFKKAMPRSKVYSMAPRESSDTNNPVDKAHTGYFYRKKKLEVKQIWSDSSKFRFQTLPGMDVSFIDGNHEYQYVYRDLVNASKITSKCVIIDDYFYKGATNPKYIYAPWNEGVVKAVNDFLKKNPQEFRNAYWIEGTKLCVLIR